MTTVLDRPMPLPAAAGKPGKPGDPNRTRVTPYVFVAPAMSGIGLFVLLPALLSFVGSFFAIPLAPGANWKWVGFDNYTYVFGDAGVHRAIENTLLYCVMTIIPSLVLGLALALLAESVRHGRTFVRTALFLPMTANLVAMAVVFKWIFALQGGFANQALAWIGVAPVNWLNDTRYSLISVALVGVWRGVSLTMLLFLAGLTTIPGAIHEAAAAEGIRGWAKLRTLILPMMKPTIVFATVLSILTSLQAFDQINVMTQGGPQESSETFLTYTWKVGFSYFELGKASALSFVLIAVLIGIGLLRRRAFSAEQR
ncbi:sugar ABC transporter permease [Frankia sp. AgPm24]|uniref:carbohydrate ABC transporter permease n=1 Tax=Frankia sp. AgPm24 TaxID=631128 RepID=UPI00200D9439|nr:sugar ABC transporter permease [Frankia sp. AgPm24]MCK9921563.1 sugar ABC transporter permease [Frankia sp. AgPm24]